jgi:2-oxoisovalerate dehydrogenase E1 component alpha subunit
MAGVSVDGNDVLAVYRVMKAAADRARAGEGPTLVEARTYRITPHSSDDDDRSYRSREEVEEWKGRDPIQRFRVYLEQAGLLTSDLHEQMDAEERAVIEAAVKFCEAAPYPEAANGLYPVYAEQIADDR